MVFSSPLFVFCFLPAVLLVHFVFKKTSFRNAILLFFSILFYAWGEPKFVFLLLVSSVVNYALALFLERSAARKKLWLFLAVSYNLTILIGFKYAYFLASSAGFWFQIDPVFLRVTLPIGISFFTFQALSYVIDVYRGHVQAQTSLARVALYIFFFPQLIAGPIVRYSTVAKQLIARNTNRPLFASGVRRFITGFAKKVLIANVVAIPADKIFALSAQDLSFSTAWFGVFCYSLQIYFDFSGYSDMAIGLGRMFGFHFPENFNFPYIATSLRDFWHRWHMTLSTWFRDYVYIPLGGNKGSAWRVHLNLFTVFFLCGLWHGASWTFALWGIYHGVFLIFERTKMGKTFLRVPRLIRHLYALFIVLIGWVFFRAESFDQLTIFLSKMFLYAQNPNELPLSMFLSNELLLICLLGVFFSMPLGRKFSFIKILPGPWIRGSTALRISLRGLQACGLVILFFISVVWMAGHTYNPFIYFRF